LTLLTAKGLDPESPGIILYDVNNTKQTILFTMASVDGTAPKLGDKVPYGFSLYCCYIKGELNRYNKWQSDDLFHIVINFKN